MPVPLGPRDPVERELELEVLAARQERVERRLLERGADRPPHRRPLRHDVVPADLLVPAVGGSSVVSMCTVVDLPAPLGPRKP